jgi:hypothetical protein
VETHWQSAGSNIRQKKTPTTQYLPAGVFLKVLLAGLVLSLTEDAVHLGATYWADALCHATTGL